MAKSGKAKCDFRQAYRQYYCPAHGKTIRRRQREKVRAVKVVEVAVTQV